MKLSRRTKRTKCAKRTKRFKLKRNTKKQFRQYKRKNTHRKHSRKLRKNKRVMRGGVPIFELLDENKNKTVNLRYKKQGELFDDTGDFTLTEKKEEITQENVTPETPQQNSCIGYSNPKEYNFTFTLVRVKDNKNFIINFKVVYSIGSEKGQRVLTISTLNKNTNQYEDFCTVIGKKSRIGFGDRSRISDLKLFDQDNNLYTFPVSSNRNKSFFEYLVIFIAKKFNVCEQEPQPKTFDNPWENEDAKYAYLGKLDPMWRINNPPPPQPTESG
jgi:hypothetical protein